jgi:hypothetical protein
MVSLLAKAGPVAPPVRYFVSPVGRDTWTGKLPTPNPERTDGPFASVGRARDAIRALKAGGPLSEPVSVQLRGGRYYFERPLTFGPEDSGTETAPISYAAYPGETPELIGGRRLTQHRRAGGDRTLVFDLPDSGTGPWTFRSLFVDGRREVRARYPNLDPSDPARKGFLYAAASPGWLAFGVTVGGIHHAGDWLDYRLKVPVSGDYILWIHYGAQNRPYGLASMDGRSSVRVDGAKAVSLADLPDTGAWSPTRWARSAVLRLTAGRHLLRWQNQKGGGLVMDVLALCDDQAWRPSGNRLAPVGQGHLVGFSAKDFTASHGSQITTATAAEGPKDAIWCGPGDIHAAWLSAPDAEVHIFPSGDCRAYSEMLSIRGYDANERRLLLGGPEARAALNPGDRYYIENVREEVDAHGEWCLDSRAGTLAYLPRAGFSPHSEVIVPRTTRIIQVEGYLPKGVPVRFLKFAGLTFRDTDWVRSSASAGYGLGDDGAVVLRNAEACVVEHCHFLNVGAYAVCLVVGRGHAIQACDVAHAGGGGVLILDSAGNRVADNHIHHLGEAYQHVGGIVLAGAGASGNILSHNAIHDSSRYGISLKNPGGGNVIEFNRIQNTNLETSDTGGIEVTQQDRTFRSGSIIRNNLVADTVGFSSTYGVPTYMSWGIYLDSFASGYDVRENLVYRTWNGGFMVQGGRENRIVNNLFVDGQVSQATLANHEQNSANLQVVGNIFAFTAPDAVVFKMGKLGPDVVKMDRNLYFPPQGVSPAFGAGGAPGLAGWQRQGWDMSSRIADPQFRNPTRDDYALLPGSPAFPLGFKALPLERVGPRTNPCTCHLLPAGKKFWKEPPSGAP